MAESHDKEPKSQKKTVAKPRQGGAKTTPTRKKPAGAKKTAKRTEAKVETPPPVTGTPAVAEAQSVAKLPPADSEPELFPREAPPVHEAPRRGERVADDRHREVAVHHEIDEDAEFNAGLWGDEPPRKEPAPKPVPATEQAPLPAVPEPGEEEPAADFHDDTDFGSEAPPEDHAIEVIDGGEIITDRPDGRTPELPGAGDESQQNGERRRRRRRGRRGRGRGRGQNGNEQANGQPGGQIVGQGGAGPVDRPRDQGHRIDQGGQGQRQDQRDQGRRHDQRDQGRPPHDQRDRREWHDQRGRQDQRGTDRRDQQRPAHDQRDQRGPREQRDQRGQRDHRERREPQHRNDRPDTRPPVEDRRPFEQPDQRGPQEPNERLEPPRPPAPAPALLIEADGEESPVVAGNGDRTMLINVAEGEECRIAILHQGRLEELFMERASTGSHVGNIYKGRVTNVEPSIQAAFIDFGLPKNGFLHISDLQPQYFPDGMRQMEEVGRKTPRRERPPIQRCLRRGQEVLVQIIKEGIGTKGPTLTTYISIPGRFLVMLPGMNRVGVSRKIEDEELRRKMRRILDELELPRDMGFILRTAGTDCAKKELQRDLQYLQRLWKVVANRIKNDRAPCELYQESDLVIRTVRDVFSADFGKIIVDDEATAEKIRDFLSIVMPRGVAPVESYKGPEPLFHKYKIEEEIERINARHVPLPLGGSLVIDSTEALVAIDVNSGRYRDLEDAEETAYRINIEAAEEIARQLRLRDLGGLIVCDFIDMRMDKHRRAVERSLRDALKRHKERAKCLRISQFGIIEMTRQRMRPSIKRSIYQDCPHCRGSGLVKNAESMTLDIMRLLRLTAHKEGVQTVEVRVSTSVAHQVLNRKRAIIVALEQESGRRIIIRADSNLGLDQYLFECLDARGGVVETLEPPLDIKPGSELRSKRNAPPNEGREGRESFEDVFE